MSQTQNYSQPSVSTGSASVDSTNRSKILGKKSRKFKKRPNLNFPHTGNYLYIIYLVLGIKSNLEMI